MRSSQARERDADEIPTIEHAENGLTHARVGTGAEGTGAHDVAAATSHAASTLTLAWGGLSQKNKCAASIMACAAYEHATIGVVAHFFNCVTQFHVSGQ